MLRGLASAVVGASLLASAATITLVTPPIASAALITSDDFTTGTLAAWTTVTGAVTVDTTIGSPAAPSARIAAAGAAAYTGMNLASPVSQLCVSTNVNVASGSGFDLFRLRTNTGGNGGPIIRVLIAADGTVQMRNDFGNAGRSNADQLGTGWHNIELCGSVGASSTWTLYRDAAVIDTWAGINTGTTGVGRVQLGDTAAKTFTANYDHVVVDQAPGDEGGAPGDTTPPTVPGTPTGTSPNSSSINVTWGASTDPSGPITYRLYRDANTTTAIYTGTATSFSDTGLGAGTMHTYRVSATDALGNLSALSAASASITVQSAPPGETNPPTVPTNVAGTSPSSSSIAVTWTASTDASPPITYRLYRDADTTTAIYTGTNTSFTDNGLGAGTVHTYRVSATDSLGNVSALSTASAPITVQAAPPAGTVTEDFTSGNFNSWLSATRLTISTTAGSPAAPSARAQVTSQSAFGVLVLPATRTQACASVNVNLASKAATAGVDLIRLRTNNGTNNGGALIKVFVAANGTLQMRNDLGSVGRTTTVQLGTGWHNVEMCGTIGINSTWTLYRDGVLINTWTGVNTGTNPIGRLQMGHTSAVTYTANFDHLVVDGAPGDGGVPPADTSAPTVPGRPAGTSPSTSSITINWAASTDASTPITYRIRRDGAATPVGTTTSTSFTDTGLAPGSSHTYTVDAVDASPALNTSAQSQASLPIVVQVPATGTQPRPNHTRLVPDIVETDDPIITTGEIFDLEYIGNRVFIAGTFTSIRNNTTGNTTSYAQPYLASYNVTTGLVDANFRPVFGGGGVTEVEASPDGTKLFVVGSFNTVNGVTKRKVASINPTTGATITTFTADANSAASSVEASNTTVYIGGDFTTMNGAPRLGLAAVNATTGATVSGFVNDLSGGIGVNGRLTVQALKLTHDGTKLLVVHTGRQIAGQDRYGVGLIDTTTNQLLPWRSRLWEDNLQFVGGINRIYAGDISPDDSYFVVTSGSGGDRPPVNDTAIAYPIAGGDNVQPLWISRLFDSVYSVAITEQAVYLGGHFNYMESPTARDPWPGLDNVGYGRGQGLAGYGLGDDIVIRDHVGAVDPVFGKAVEWHPASNSFEGNKAMLATPLGIITGGDATTQGGYNVARIAYYPFDNIPTSGANETTIETPIQGRVEEAGLPFTVTGTARATSGVQRVQLEVRDRDRPTNQSYLQDNLTTWGAANTINVPLANPNATNTTWSIDLTLFENRRIELMARTVGVNGSQDASKANKKIETFGLSDATPSTGISGPSGIVPTTTFTVNGTATDDVGVNSITITMRDSQNRYLQNDGSTSAAYNSFRATPDVIGAPNATWSYEITVPYEGEWTMQAIAVDTEGQSDLRSADRTWLVSDTAIAPTVTIVAPVEMIPPTTTPVITLAPGGQLTFSGTATDDEGLNYVSINLSNSVTREVLTAGGTWGVDLQGGDYRISGPNNLNGTTYNWSYTTPFNLVPGVYSFSVEAVDDLGLTTSNTNRGRLTINVQVPGDAFPNATIAPTGTINGTQVLRLDLAGSATDDIGVSAVRLSIEDRDSGRYIQPNGTLSAAYALLNATLLNPGATSTNWTLTVDLPVEGDYAVTAIAFDTSNQQDPSSSGATSRYPVYPGDLPPVITENLFQPAEGTVSTDGRIYVSGRVEDDQQIVRAQVAVRNALGQYMSSSGQFTSTNQTWITAFLNSPGSPGSNYSYTTPVIPNGDYTVMVRGVDQHDFVTPVPSERNVSVTGTTTSLPPVANFTSSCVQNVCTFDGRSSTDEVPATLVYSWVFGNGNGSGPVPVRTYTSAGTFTVTLTVRDENNLTSVISKTVTIAEPAANVAPTAVFNLPSCNGRTCVLSSAGSTDPNVGDSLSYFWSFGDNPLTTSTSSNPTKTFLADGSYVVTLVVTDGWGRSSTAQRTINISEPVGNLPPIPVISAPVCIARTCNFFAPSSSDPENNTFTYLWSFGQSPTPTTSTSATPTVTYVSDGNYTVTLTLTDVWGRAASTTVAVPILEPGDNDPPVPVIPLPTCVLRTCSMSSAGSADPEGDAFTYAWNFGDATTSTASAPSKTWATNGPFTVTLTLTDAWGNVGTVTREVSFTEPGTNVAPIPVIATPVCSIRTCTFAATGSADPNGDTYSYSWSFADTPSATTSTSATPTKTWVADGTYTVTLTLTDVWGKFASVTRDVVIAKPLTNAAPTPVISAPVCAARVCTIPGISSSDPNGDPFTYLWSWADIATTATSSSVSRTFTVDATYTLTLRVTDAWGDFATTSLPIVIDEPGNNVAPVPVINAPTCVGRTCAFSSAGTIDAAGDPITYSWNWGDATANSTTANPSHTFAGTATSIVVTLTVTDGWGKAASTTLTVAVP